MTLIVETEAVDHRLILDQAEDARLWIAWLRLRGDRPDLGEAEAELQQRLGHLGILVEAGGHAERIDEVEASNRLPQARIGGQLAGRHKSGLQSGNRQAMGRFGIDKEQAATGDGLEEIDHGSISGN